MQQRLDQLRTQDAVLFNGKTADQPTTGKALPPLPQYARSTVRVSGGASLASASSPERWQASEPTHEQMPTLDEGPTIEVQNRLHPAPMFNISNRDDRTRGTQQPATGGQGGTIQLSSDSGSMLTDPGSPAADPGRPKVDTPQGTGSGQGTGGSQSTSGGQPSGGGQNGGSSGSGGGQAADAGAPPADNGQQTGSGTHIPEVIDIQASDMQWDPAHAKLHQGDGEVFVYSNSSVDAQFTLDSPGQGLSIFARADKANGQWPTMTVSIDGTPIGTVTVNSTVEKKFYFPISVDPGQVNLQLSYTNDFFDPNAHQDRNLYISHVKVVAQGTTQGH